MMESIGFKKGSIHLAGVGERWLSWPAPPKKPGNGALRGDLLAD
jgi:hypothetical protein